MPMVTLLLSLALGAAVPDANVLCATPQRATRTFLDNLQAGRYQPEVAAVCSQMPEGVTRREQQLRIEQLKQVFDARGLMIAVDRLPDTSDFVDPSTGRAEVELHSGLSEVVLVKDNVGWRFPARVMQRVPALAAATFVFDLSSLVPRLPTWLQHRVLGVAGWQILYVLVLIFLGMMLRLIVTWFVAGWARRMMERLKINWGRDLLHQASRPMGTLALAGVLVLGMPAARLSVGVAAVATIAIRLIAALAGVMVLYRIVDLFSAYLSSRADATETKLDDQLVPLVRRALRVVVIALGAIFVLQNLDVDVASLVAGLGLGGLAFALAAKDTVANLFGSITIFLDKPFQIGDWIAAAGTEGVVEEVGFRSTRVRTFYNSLVSVPNAKIADAIIDNYGLRKYRRCNINLGLTYDTTPDQIEAFCNGVRAIIKAHPATRKDYYEVHFAGFGDFSLNIMLYFFFEVPSWTDELRARHEVYMDLLRLAERLGVEYAFPTRTLHMASQAMPKPMDPPSPPQTEWLSQRVKEFAPGGRLVIPPGPRLDESYLAGSSIVRDKSQVMAEEDSDDARKPSAE